MPKSRTGRVRRTEKQWTEILRRFEASGEGSRQFLRSPRLAGSRYAADSQRHGAHGFALLLRGPTRRDALGGWCL